MTALRTVSICIVALVSLLAPRALGQPERLTGRYLTRFESQMLSCWDLSTGRILIRPNSQTVTNGTSLPRTTQFTPRPDGFDLAVTYTNTGTAPAPLGTITIPGFRFGRVVNYRNFLTDAQLQTADHQNREYWGAGYRYPSLLFSPVFTLGDAQTTFGISVLYPTVEYRSEVGIQLTSPGGDFAVSGRNWEVVVWLHGSLAPGESRCYTVAVRINPDPAQWLRTLLPYRAHFQSLYGGLGYQRDPRPVSGLVINNPECQAAANPMGFCDIPTARPDLAGWEPVAVRFRARPQLGYNRMMLWRPTGLFHQNPHLNFPFQFMSHMTDIPPMDATRAVLAALPGPQLQVGYWWGRSQEVMAGWDNGLADRLNLSNPTHVSLALREFDLAGALNADLIGMDAFIGLPDWLAFQWLSYLANRNPRIKFIVEREWGAPDFLCTLAPTWVNARDIQTPRILADFLLPGHETWCGIGVADWLHLQQLLGRPLTHQDRLNEIGRVAALGYIPVIFDDFDISGHNFNAAESWRSTIPRDLQLTIQSPGP